MGNVFSIFSTEASVNKNQTMNEGKMMNKESAPNNEEEHDQETFYDTVEEDKARAKAKEDEMNEFKKQLDIKRAERKKILSRHRNEKEELEKSLQNERHRNLKISNNNKLLIELLTKNNIDIPENLESSVKDETTDIIYNLTEEFDNLRASNNRLRRDLSESNSALQNAYSDIADLTAQNTESIKHISALKDVVSVSKTMINLREEQLNELKNKLNEIEKSLADRETHILSNDLRQEYERQLQNIRTLRGLYEERARLAEITRQGLLRELDEQKLLNQIEINKCKDLTTKLQELESQINTLHEIVENKNEQINSFQDETHGLKAEMSVVNKLFSQVLLGYKTKDDLDKLVHRLEENHAILTHMAEKESTSEASSALPKLLLKIVTEIDENDEKVDENAAESIAGSSKLETKAEDIVQKLPKVWKVLIELLSHQDVSNCNSSEKVTTCYKSVETKSGPVLVPSVSQTYIRLKDLIVEKLALIKEVSRMKKLNGHLETRLEEQERRLCLVTTELSKTWHVVSRLRKHHQQLHTHEKILKYELQQKRKLLNELKEELEYCREKWEQAREKNSQSERDYKNLRAEFSNRKTKLVSSSLNNSAESGYSDERPSDDSSESYDESEYVVEPIAKFKKKNQKSFETMVDSSTDFLAEKEDPVSDLIDVTDLPLDTHEGDENQTSICESCTTENLLKSEKYCDETEDEIGEVIDESFSEENATEITYDYNRSNQATGIVINKIKNEETVEPTNINISESISSIDAAAILESIKQQNKRLAQKDKRLNDLEKHSAEIWKKSQETANLRIEINQTLDNILNRPSTSTNRVQRHENEISSCDENIRNNTVSSTTNDNSPQSEKLQETHNLNMISKIGDDQKTSEAVVTLKLETFSNQKNTLGSKTESSQILHLINQERPTNIQNTESNTLSEPSTSSDIDHEARFADRDRRLKRLEEQTKSLVNKVNKTNSKGVKIHYKLEELHNIYGSENSRAGTPENENISHKSEDGSQSE